MTGDPLDVSLEDVELLDEVELTTNLIIAASLSSGPLSAGRLDELLGLEKRPVPRAPWVPRQPSR